MKLPKPHLIGGTFLPISGFEGSDYGYTEAQMLQFRRDALEEAAKVAAATVCDTHIPTGVKIYGQRAGKAIRALLKDET
jgi:hypothetical protein